ncbi:hypothetical protein BLNAU_11552 [Blattamonas nauphoetae]|uniref:C2 domain-containing protein n=1 Tax=Blattamonas nauphoetae TaxID=2049346 RepID=A0ABQ9XQ87_9EUKA|nr:hypothetical protein BLNAU_11552 [Blattamonas nauphoetae]
MTLNDSKALRDIFPSLSNDTTDATCLAHNHTTKMNYALLKVELVHIELSSSCSSQVFIQLNQGFPTHKLMKTEICRDSDVPHYRRNTFDFVISPKTKTMNPFLSIAIDSVKKKIQLGQKQVAIVANATEPPKQQEDDHTIVRQRISMCRLGIGTVLDEISKFSVSFVIPGSLEQRFRGKNLPRIVDFWKFGGVKEIQSYGECLEKAMVRDGLLNKRQKNAGSDNASQISSPSVRSDQMSDVGLTVPDHQARKSFYTRIEYRTSIPPVSAPDTPSPLRFGEKLLSLEGYQQSNLTKTTHLSHWVGTSAVTAVIVVRLSVLPLALSLCSIPLQTRFIETVPSKFASSDPKFKLDGTFDYLAQSTLQQLLPGILRPDTPPLPTPQPVAIPKEPSLPPQSVVEGGEAPVQLDGEQPPQQQVEESVVRQLVTVPRIPRPVLIRLTLFWAEAKTTKDDLEHVDDPQKQGQRVPTNMESLPSHTFVIIRSTDPKGDVTMSEDAVFETVSTKQKGVEFTELHDRGFFYQTFSVTTDIRCPLVIALCRRQVQTESNPWEEKKKTVLMSFCLSLLDFHHISPTPRFLRVIDPDTGYALSFSISLQSQQRIRQHFATDVVSTSCNVVVPALFEEALPFPPVIVCRFVQDWKRNWGSMCEHLYRGESEPQFYEEGYPASLLPFDDVIISDKQQAKVKIGKKQRKKIRMALAQEDNDNSSEIEELAALYDFNPASLPPLSTFDFCSPTDIQFGQINNRNIHRRFSSEEGGNSLPPPPVLLLAYSLTLPEPNTEKEKRGDIVGVDIISHPVWSRLFQSFIPVLFAKAEDAGLVLEFYAPLIRHETRFSVKEREKMGLRGTLKKRQKATSAHHSHTFLTLRAISCLPVGNSFNREYIFWRKQKTVQPFRISNPYLPLTTGDSNIFPSIRVDCILFRISSDVTKDELDAYKENLQKKVVSVRPYVFDVDQFGKRGLWQDEKGDVEKPEGADEITDLYLERRDLITEGQSENTTNLSNLKGVDETEFEGAVSMFTEEEKKQLEDLVEKEEQDEARRTKTVAAAAKRLDRINEQEQMEKERRNAEQQLRNDGEDLEQLQRAMEDEALQQDAFLRLGKSSVREQQKEALMAMTNEERAEFERKKKEDEDFLRQLEEEHGEAERLKKEEELRRKAKHDEFKNKLLRRSNLERMRRKKQNEQMKELYLQKKAEMQQQNQNQNFGIDDEAQETLIDEKLLHQIEEAEQQQKLRENEDRQRRKDRLNKRFALEGIQEAPDEDEMEDLLDDEFDEAEEATFMTGAERREKERQLLVQEEEKERQISAVRMSISIGQKMREMEAELERRREEMELLREQVSQKRAKKASQ